jgi:hypothetical protein
MDFGRVDVWQLGEGRIVVLEEGGALVLHLVATGRRCERAARWHRAVM